MSRDQLAIHHHVCAGRAKIGGRTLAFRESPQQLNLDRDRESLMEGHRLGRLRVEHDSVVADGPTEIGTGAPDLLADEAIFDGDDVMREGLLVEDVPELAVERAPLVVANLEQTFLDPERVADVLTERVARELDGPVIQVGAVEELNPFFLMRLTRLQAAGRIVLRPTGRDEKRDRQGGGCEWTVELFRIGCRQ